METVRETRARVAPHDAVSTVESYGVQVFRGTARFVGRDVVEVGDARLRFRRALVATGTRAALLDVPGLAEAGYLTNESIFALTERPRRLAITLVGEHAGELVAAVSLAMTSGLTLADLGRAIVPYPTRSEVWKRLADERARRRLTPGLKRWIERLLSLLRRT